MTLERLMQNPYAWTILSVCTIAAFIFAIYTWVTGKRKKEISHIYSTYEVVKAGKSIVPELQLLFQGKSIENLTITRYAIWNSGNEVLNPSDIVDVKPLTITSRSDNAHILDAKIVKQSDDTNMFKIVKKDDKYIEIKFDYMDRRNGIILQVLHTGVASELKVDCKIKGGKQLKNLAKNRTYRKNIKKGKKAFIISVGIECALVVMMAIITLLADFNIISFDCLQGPIPFEEKIMKFFPLILLTLVATMLFMYWKLFEKVYHINIPSTLRNDIEYEQ